MPESHFPIFKATSYIGGIRDAAGKRVAFRLRASIILLNMTRSPSVFRRGISSALGWVTFSLAIGVAGASILGAAKQQAPVVLRSSDAPEEIAHKASQVVPAPRQVAWQKLEFVGFAHFGMNTFTNREWGTGREDPRLFNPADFDARQWVAAFRAAGMKMLILTAKHHDGFCLWPSRYTEHSVRNSPWRAGRGDVVREVADACHAAGLKFGIYLSPWDRHEPTYGDSAAYNEHFKNQLRELLTNYGEVANVWFDGANGEGPNGKRQVYDWQGYWDVIRTLQPRATISIIGPDARWCGNEAGIARASEWSVIPMLHPMTEISSDGLGGLNPQQKDLGSRQALLEAAKLGARLIWYPAQVDISIRPGWFYHPAEDSKVRSLDQLLDIYYGAVGGNCQLLLNIPPDTRGRIHEDDVRRLKELGQALSDTFGRNLAEGAKATASSSRSGKFSAAKTIDHKEGSYWRADDGVTAAIIAYDLRAPVTFNVALLQEQITVGQRIEEFFLDAWSGSGWKEIARSTTVGYKRLLRFPEVTVAMVRLRITQSRDYPTLSNFGLYRSPADGNREPRER